MQKDFMIILAWPEGMVTAPDSWYDKIASTNGKYRVGHSALVLVNSNSKQLEYFDFGRSQGMKHLVLDGSNLKNSKLSHIFENENQYSFLKKIYDSKEQNYSYHVKAYEIDYENMNLKIVNKIND